MCKVSQGNWEKSKKKINGKEKKKEDRGKKGELESHGLVFLLLGPPLKFSSLPSLLSFSPSSSSSSSSSPSSPFLRLDSSSFFSLPSAMAEDKVLFLPEKNVFFFFLSLYCLVGEKTEWPRNGRVENVFVISVVKRTRVEFWSGMCDLCFCFFCLLAQLTKGRLGFVIFGGIRFSFWTSGLWT